MMNYKPLIIILSLVVPILVGLEGQIGNQISNLIEGCHEETYPNAKVWESVPITLSCKNPQRPYFLL